MGLKEIRRWVPVVSLPLLVLGLFFYLGLVGCFYDNEDSSDRGPVSDDEKQAQKVIIDKATAAFNSEDYASARDLFETALYSRYSDGRPYYLYALSHYYSVGYDQELLTEAVEKLRLYDNDEAMIDSAIRVIIDNTPAMEYRKAKVDDYSRGELVVIEGGVVQDLNPIRMKNSFSVSTEYDDLWGFGLRGDEIIIEFDENPKLLEGDIVRLLAAYGGSKRIEKTNGEKVDIPIFTGFHIIQIREEQF